MICVYNIYLEFWTLATPTTNVPKTDSERTRFVFTAMSWSWMPKIFTVPGRSGAEGRSGRNCWKVKGVVASTANQQVILSIYCLQGIVTLQSWRGTLYSSDFGPCGARSPVSKTAYLGGVRSHQRSRPVLRQGRGTKLAGYKMSPLWCLVMQPLNSWSRKKNRDSSV